MAVTLGAIYAGTAGIEYQENPTLKDKAVAAIKAGAGRIYSNIAYGTKRMSRIDWVLLLGSNLAVINLHPLWNIFVMASLLSVAIYPKLKNKDAQLMGLIQRSQFIIATHNSVAADMPQEERMESFIGTAYKI